MKKGYFYILCATILFSSMEIALKMVAADFNPIQMTFLRFVIGTIILWPLARRDLAKRGITFERSHIPFFLWTGFLCVVVSMTFFQLAIMYTHAATVAILFSCNAVFVIPLACLFLNEKINFIGLVSIALSLIGMVFIIDPENLQHARGIILSLLSAATFALYGIFGQKGRKKYGYSGLSLTYFSFLAGCIEMFLLMCVSHSHEVAQILLRDGLNQFAYIPFLKDVNWHTAIALIYLGVFVTGMGYSCYFLAMEETSASTASMVFFIKPALAPILALIILGEALTENIVVGILCIVAGSCLTFVAHGIHQYNLRRSYENQVLADHIK
ncbi:MAG: hypothetical protein CENE_02933 [Candidatus Celerinatantimonas neptuna]|nr:MAG: hypothetical protein CENE_02933 [Candidatus Celerinatantimonas neptuna]